MRRIEPAVCSGVHPLAFVSSREPLELSLKFHIRPTLHQRSGMGISLGNRLRGAGSFHSDSATSCTGHTLCEGGESAHLGEVSRVN